MQCACIFLQKEISNKIIFAVKIFYHIIIFLLTKLSFCCIFARYF